MSDTFLAPDDIERAFPSVDHSLSKPLWLVGINFFSKKLVIATEWSSPETTGAFGQWVKLYTGVSYVAKQGFNLGPRRGFYLAEMADEDLLGSQLRKLQISSSPSDSLLLPEAKSTLLVGTFLGPTGMPFIQSPIHGGRKAKSGGGGAASVGLVLHRISVELESESWLLRSLLSEFVSHCKDDRAPFEDPELSHAVPFVLTEAVTTVDWAEIAVESGVVPESMFEDPPESTEAPLSSYVDERDAKSTPPLSDELIPNLRAEFVHDGELDFRGLFDWTFEEPTSDEEILIHEFYTSHLGETLDDLFENEFKSHWVDLTRVEREEQLLTLIQFDNAMTVSDYEPGEELTGFDVSLALISSKVFMFALAVDATYDTGYLKGLQTDPLAFGIHEFGSEDDEV